jgi:hypothetical protein
MNPRAWCRGPERHLVIDSLHDAASVYPLKITVAEVVVA